MLLLTGASGPLGQALLEWLPQPVVALQHRSKASGTATIRGDLTDPRWLPRECGQITAILHCAALTEFTAPVADLRRVNVEGTRNLLRVARVCPRLERIGVLSTAYVAGRRTGQILESDLEHNCGFVNPYERSKYEMERLLRRAMASLPIAVYRLSTVADRPAALHDALRLYYRALVPMVPGVAGSVVDLISARYAAQSVARLFTNAFDAGKTYHIVAPRADRIALQRFLEITAGLFGEYSPRWRSGALSPPPVVPLKTFEKLERSARLAGNPVLRQVLHATGAFLPQLCYPKDFDTRNVERGLRGSGIRPRPLLEYYPEIVRDCVSRGPTSRI